MLLCPPPLPPAQWGIKQCYNPSVCLSHALCSDTVQGLLWSGNPVLKVEPTAQRGLRKWPKHNEAVAGAASEAFAKWLHHRYASIELHSAVGLRFAARYFVSVGYVID